MLTLGEKNPEIISSSKYAALIFLIYRSTKMKADPLFYSMVITGISSQDCIEISREQEKSTFFLIVE